jgi:transposase
LSLSSVYNYLKRLNYSQICPRTLPVKRDEEAVLEFKLDYWTLYYQCDLWFFDETGVENDRRPRRVWAKKGSKPIWYYSGNHIRENIMGAVNPSSGEFEALIISHNDTETFQYYLDHLNSYMKDRRIVMVLDNASWHKTQKLNWGNITPLYLPAYSPDLNPIEELWKVIKDRLCDPIPAKTHEELQDRIQVILKQLFKEPSQVQSICKINYAIS